MSSSASASASGGFESKSFGWEEEGESTLFKEASDDHHSPYGQTLPPEEGDALILWRRQNAIRLEEKEKREKEILNEIIEEAEEHKAEFYRKWKVRVENNKISNREKEKLLLENQEKFHAEASKNYWKAAAEMIPREVPTIEKKGKKKDQDKQPSIVVIHGPKPGKPTDLSRMRQVFLKLKHKPPPHMNPPPSTPSSTSSASSASSASPASTSSIPGQDGKSVASTPATSAAQKLQATAAPKSVTAE